jgi:two-component system chemotaxis sensor kinase CheA
VNHGRSIAERITKDVAFEVEANGVRLERDHLQAFWSDVVHVVRNAVDHGVEYPYERSQAGKPETARVRLSLERVQENLVVEVSDDGAGIDWDALKNIAESRGMPHQTLDDLTLVMFADGVTTRRGATEFSGRGVGLAAVYNGVQELGGTVEVDSLPGEGTTMRFTLPLPSQPPGLSIAV